MKLLMVGPKSPPVGGTTVLFEQLCSYIVEHTDFELTVMNTSPAKLARSPISILRFFLGTFNSVSKHDIIVLHSSSSAMLLFGGATLKIATALQQKKWVYRNFGGRFPLYWQKLSGFKRYLLQRTVLSADVLLFETHESVSFVKSLTESQVNWFPNSRVVSPNTSLRSGPARRFVFISHVKPSKGIRILIQAAKGLKGIDIDVYGPLEGGVIREEFEGSLVNYKGELVSSMVRDTLCQYDVLLLPTFYQGEGYPGIILEAYSVGMPVITTRWRCISEIADQSCAILTEPNNVGQLQEAIQSLVDDELRVNELRKNAAQKSLEFSSDKWSKVFVDTISKLGD